MEMRLCSFNRHRPRDHAVAWDEDQFTYTGECRHCGETILSSGNRRWVRAVPLAIPEFEPVEYPG